MADPLSALAIAAAVVQFVDFGSRIVIDGYGSYKSINGATRSDVDVKELAEDLKILCTQLSPAAGTCTQDAHNPVPTDETQLRDVASRCLKLAIELAETLHGLVVGADGTMRVWETVRKTIKRKFEQRWIKSLQEDLESVKSQLALHMLNTIRNSQSSTMTHVSALKAHANTLHENYIVELDHVKNDLVQVMEQLKEPMVEIAAQRRALENAMDRANQMQSLDHKIKTKTILNSLRFPEIYDREYSIHDAHEQTFEWIFQHEEFNHWLSQGSGLYWISGKAGSGKSTFMKFLIEHCDTKRLLQSWSGNDKLVVLSFYLWASGVHMQKTQNGLFQSLLLQLLSSCPSMIPECLPRRWMAMDEDQYMPMPWSNKELIEAFKLVLLRTPTTKFCIFIDGLDEFAPSDVEGDYHDLIKIISEMLDWGNTKICVSSRPWPQFRAAYPRHLALQDFTRPDMEVFITDLLCRDKRIEQVAKGDIRVSDLVEELTTKADGVFLWVFLSVRALLRGFHKSDGIEDLRTRLRTLPSDMKSFFQRMVDGIEDLYVNSAVWLLDVVANHERVPLVLVKYIPMELKKTDAVFDPDLQLFAAMLSPSAWDEFKNTAINRINAWCGDLLEVRTPGGLSKFTCTINVLHRTVKDFLLEPETLEVLRGSSERCCEPTRLLMQATLYQIKSEHHILHCGTSPEKIWLPNDLLYSRKFAIYSILKLARQKLLHTGLWSSDILEATAQASYPMPQQQDCQVISKRAYHDPVEVAIELDFPEYLERYVVTADSLHLSWALTRVPLQNLEIVEILLKKGANPNGRLTPDLKPNEKLTHDTVWQSFIRNCMFSGDREHTEHQKKVRAYCAQLMLSHGADPDAKVELSSGMRDGIYHALGNPSELPSDWAMLPMPEEWRDRYHASKTSRFCSDEHNIACP